MYEWQLNLLDKMTRYKGKGFVQITGRQTGKSFMSSSAFQRLWNDLYSPPVSDLKLDQGTVYGARYYTVQPEGGNWLDMEAWCVEMFGEGNVSPIWGEEKAPEPAQRWYTNNRKFWFRDEQDRMIFVLKWR
jgi:hypothetical protein